MEEDIPDPVVVLDLLKILTTPSLQSAATGSSEEFEKLSTFEQLLKSNLDKFHEENSVHKFRTIMAYFGESNLTKEAKTGSEIKWSFTCHCLKILEILCTSTNHAMKVFHEKEEMKKQQEKELKPSQGPPLSPDTLSVGQQKSVLTAIQFVIVLGLSPNLEEGVGLHANKRSGFGEVIDLQDEDDKVDDFEKCSRMIRCVRVLLKCSKIESLGTLIFSRHLGDILAALLQLVHRQKCMQQQRKSAEGCQSDNIERTTAIGNSAATENAEKVNFGIVNSSASTPSEKWTPATIVDLIVKQQSINDIDCSNSNQQRSSKDTSNLSLSIDNQNSVLKESEFQIQENTALNEIVVDRQDFDFCEDSLNDLLEKISQPLLVRELLVLQGGPGKQTVQKGDGVNKQMKPVLIKAPGWLRKVCGQLLTGILMKPHGVLHVLHGMLGNAVVDTSGNIITDWRKFDAVAKVIASCPKMSSSTEEYYKLVSPQILSLLHYPNKQMAKHFLRVACSTVVNMADSCPELTYRYLIRPLIKPLLSCTHEHDFDIGDTQQIVVEEQSLSLCIEDIHKVFVAGTEPNSTLSTYLIPVIQPLFQLFCFTKQGISHLRSACHEILVTSLNQYPKDVSLQCLQCLVLHSSPSTMEAWKYLHPNLMFAAGSDGGVVVVTKPKEGYSVPESIQIEGIIDLLKDLQRHGLTGDFFLFMLKELSSIIQGEITEPIIELHHGKNVLESDGTETNERKICILNLLACLCETIGPSCLKNTQQTLDFVEVTLERAVHIIQACEDEETTMFENETLTMAMGLLTSVLTGGLQCDEDDRNHMKKMLPLLQSLADNHPDAEVQAMASDLRVAIATHGVVWSERLAKSSENKQQTSKENTKSKPKHKPKPLIEIVDQQEDTSPRPTKTDEKGKSDETVLSSFQEALKELCDPLIPMRGHGLISLCKLVENNDRETMDKQEVVLSIFEENLNHPDSYLYLSSARGLSLLADKCPDQIIPRLASEFANFDKAERSSELRMKLGECLLQSTRKLGDMTPKYRDVLLSALLTGARDKDPLVRASSLSNLGEVCKTLKFSLGNVISEILTCCKSLLKTDDSPEVRKAAALLTTSLLQGLGQDVLKVLDTMLLDLYKLLKMTLKTEKDDKVKDHIVLSLNELDTIMRDCLFPKQTLQKKIRVLDKT